MTSISPLTFIAPPARTLVINNKEKLENILKRVEAGQYIHLDERRIYLDIYRLCSISFAKDLPGYKDLNVNTYRKIVSKLLSEYLKSTRYAWASSRGEDHFVFMDVSPSRDNVLKTMGEFLENSAKNIIFDVLTNDGYEIKKTKINLAHYLWMSIGRSHEEPGEILVLKARKQKANPKFYLADQLAATDTVISGAIISMMGSLMLHLFKQKYPEIDKGLNNGELLPLIHEAETEEEDDFYLKIKKKKIDYPIHIVRKDKISKLKSSDKSIITKITTEHTNFLKNFIIETFYTHEEFDKKLSKDQKKKLGVEPFYIDINSALYINIDIAGYSNLTSKIDRLKEISRLVKNNKDAKRFQYAARNTHTMVMGLQSLLAQWNDLATEIFTKYDFKTGEHGGDGMGAIIEDLDPDEASKVALEVCKQITCGFEKYLHDFHKDGGFSEARVIVDLINEIYPDASDRPFLKVAVAYLSDELKMRVTPAGDYVVTDLIIESDEAGDYMNKMMKNLKTYTREYFPDHYRVVALNNELGSRIESFGKEESKNIFHGKLTNINEEYFFEFDK